MLKIHLNMDQSLEITNIKNEPTESTTNDQLEIPTEMNMNSGKQERDCLVQSAIYIKMETQEDEKEVPIFKDTPYEMCSYNNIKFTMIKIEHKDLEDNIIEDPLDNGDKIKDEEHSPIGVDNMSRIKTEPIEEETDKNLLKSGTSSNHQDQLLVTNDVYENKKYVCNLCNRTFTLKSNLNVHLHSHIGQMLFTCDICKKSFNTIGNLDTHMLIHTGEKSLICDVCKKVFKHKCRLNEHKLTHSRIKPFSCNECNQSFTQKSNLIRHKRKHTGEKPFTCDLCDKPFKHKADLAKHERIHTGEKPYSCDNCNKSFAVKTNLNKHKKMHKN